MLRIHACLCAFVVLACSTLPVAAQQPAASAIMALSPTGVTYYGCVNNATGAIRIVSSGTICKTTEHKIHWNQVGPHGPQGKQGRTRLFATVTQSARRSFVSADHQRTGARHRQGNPGALAALCDAARTEFAQCRGGVGEGKTAASVAPSDPRRPVGLLKPRSEPSAAGSAGLS